MPIRINLLAEAHALEELRQRDPVKRVILIGACLAMLILAYSSSLWVKTIMARGEVHRLEQDIETRKTEYAQIMTDQKNLFDGGQKLLAMHKLSTNRFLVGNLLQTLSDTTLPDVQLTSLMLQHSYFQTEEVRQKSGGPRVTPKPATSRENIVLTLQARDRGANPGDAVNIYKDRLATNAYFTALLGRTNQFRLMNLGAPQTDETGKPFVSFTLQAKFQEKTR